MAFKEYAKREYSFFRQSLKLDRRFGMILLWEILLIVAMFVGVSVWANEMEALTPLIERASLPFSSEFTIENSMLLQNTDELMEEIQTRMVLYSSLIVLYILLVWPFFKCLTYTTLRLKKITAKFYGKFILATVVWTLLLAVVFFIIQYIFYTTIFDSLPYSAASRMTLLFGSILVFVLFCYFTITLFITFTKLERFKETILEYLRVPVKGIRYFLMPMLFSFIVFIALNILMRFAAALPKNVSFILTTAMVLAYVAWLKVYYDSCVDRIAKGAVKQGRKKK